MNIRPVAALSIALLLAGCSRESPQKPPPSVEAVPSAPAVMPAGSEPSPADELEMLSEMLSGFGLGDLAGLTASLEPGPVELGAWPLPETPADWPARAVVTVPLVAELALTTAIEDTRGDYESTKHVAAVGADAVRIVYRTAGVRDNPDAPPVHTQRLVLREDLERSTGYRMAFSASDPIEAPGWTAIGVSRLVLEALRREGESPIQLIRPQEGLAGLIETFEGGAAELFGTLRRLSPGPVAVPVLVNGERRWLAAIHAGGMLAGIVQPQQVEFLFLDDPANPITLRAAVGRTRVQLVRIDMPEHVSLSSRLEQALGEQETVTLPGLYFETASARLDEESGATLDELAILLRARPEWELAIEGHTDNVGDNKSNDALSRARAEAVRAALIARVPDTAARLNATGYGASRPVESNDTLEGRARNRRVDLRRL